MNVPILRALKVLLRTWSRIRREHHSSHRGNTRKGCVRFVASQSPKEDKSTAPMHAALGLCRNSIITDESAPMKSSARYAENPSLQTGPNTALTHAGGLPGKGKA